MNVSKKQSSKEGSDVFSAQVSTKHRPSSRVNELADRMYGASGSVQSAAVAAAAARKSRVLGESARFSRGLGDSRALGERASDESPRSLRGRATISGQLDLSRGERRSRHNGTDFACVSRPDSSRNNFASASADAQLFKRSQTAQHVVMDARKEISDEGVSPVAAGPTGISELEVSPGGNAGAAPPDRIGAPPPSRSSQETGGFGLHILSPVAVIQNPDMTSQDTNLPGKYDTHQMPSDNQGGLDGHAKIVVDTDANHTQSPNQLPTSHHPPALQPPPPGQSPSGKAQNYITKSLHILRQQEVGGPAAGQRRLKWGRYFRSMASSTEAANPEHGGRATLPHYRDISLDQHDRVSLANANRNIERLHSEESDQGSLEPTNSQLGVLPFELAKEVENLFSPNKNVFRSRWKISAFEDDEKLSFFDATKAAVLSLMDTYKHVVVSQFFVLIWAAILHSTDIGIPFFGLGPLEKDFFTNNMYLRPEVVALFSGMISFLLVFRINLAYARWWESRHHVEQFAIRWFNCALTCCIFDQYTVTTSMDRWLFRRRVAGLVSLMHASACEELHEACQFESLALTFLDPDAMLEFFGIESNKSDVELLHCQDAPFRDRVSQCFAWMVMLITGRFAGGNHMVAAPIVSRLYVMLEDGYKAFYDAMIVRNTKFPSPFTTIIYISVGLLCVVVPLAIHVVPFAARETDQAGFFWKCLLNICSTYGFIALAQVASSLEDPFGDDTFDHPLDNYQIDFDLELVDLLEKCDFDVPMAQLPPEYEDDENYSSPQTKAVRWNRDEPPTKIASGPTAPALRALRNRRTHIWDDEFESDDSAIDDMIRVKPSTKPEMDKLKQELRSTMAMFPSSGTATVNAERPTATFVLNRSSYGGGSQRSSNDNRQTVMPFGNSVISEGHFRASDPSSPLQAKSAENRYISREILPGTVTTEQNDTGRDTNRQSVSSEARLSCSFSSQNGFESGVSKSQQQGCGEKMYTPHSQPSILEDVVVPSRNGDEETGILNDSDIAEIRSNVRSLKDDVIN